MPKDTNEREPRTRSIGNVARSYRGASRSRSQSGNKSRRDSLTILSGPTRSIRTINIESDDDYSSTASPSTYSNHSDNETENPDSRDSMGSLSSKLQYLKLQGDSGSSGASEALEVPFVKVTLDPTLPRDYLKKDILTIIDSLRIPKWHLRGSLGKNTIDVDNLKLTQITGAMTNMIFKVAYPRLPSLLLRVYGSNNDTIIDREYELQKLARLSQHHIGPSLYGCFENGRFEQFLENSQTLKKNDVRSWRISQRIARRMKELHTGVPLLRSERGSRPVSLKLIDKWISVIEDVGATWLTEKSNVTDIIQAKDWDTFKKVVSRYEMWLLDPNYSKTSEKLVFCHNDTQYGNLLFSSPMCETPDSGDYTPVAQNSSSSISSLFPSASNISLHEIINPSKEDKIEDNKLIVIDFEYAGANPAAFDLANHLSEWMHNYNCDTPHKCEPQEYPSKEQVLNFLYSYVSHLRGGAKTSIDEDVKNLYNSIIRWRAAAQLFWSIWAVIQSGKLVKENTTIVNKEEIGPGGEKYIIKTEELDDGLVKEESIQSEEIESLTGVDIGSFDYLSFCRHKIALFWSDMIQLGLANKEDCTIQEAISLDTKFL
ncbi:hypothetical protein TPHA_0C00780 [Tetrapisispora phaffii CBS 4417]|uniref:Choline kinase N-terminal domain-containing protein n=1 Tax=Tetrapisispora phaffii (strain ATCC 24235 / CBS 4417 / NBRC 1672 / NRRL Y-8282 / UCD 70-5) TaxID=1071381 RepID=G8BR58_TETPH|nr:hypothetical protein TPHA_0C00780 [Tetrapisispora phaffii CBS 4417]CCE62234.1 hypothetical protein TPHA_0C00780 [Tetrapisispora phaffii CBS 4417]